MKFLCGLALAVIFFEGFISQCYGSGPPTSIHGKNYKSNLEKLEDTLFGENRFKKTSTPHIREILENYTIYICPKARYRNDTTMEEYERNGEKYLSILGENRNLQLLDEFGQFIRKIQVNYEYIRGRSVKIRFDLNHIIITKCASKLTEIRIISEESCYLFLKQLLGLGNKNKIRFPNVTKLVYRGPDPATGSFNLKEIFPNASLTLESLYPPNYPDIRFEQGEN